MSEQIALRPVEVSAATAKKEVGPPKVMLDAITWAFGGTGGTNVLTDRSGPDFSQVTVRSSILRSGHFYYPANVLTPKSGEVYSHSPLEPAERVGAWIPITATASSLGVYSDKVDEIRGPLDGYERYEEANWDGYGAAPISAQTLSFARQVLAIIPTGLGAFDVSPTSDGAVSFEWSPEKGKAQRLVLEAGPGETWRAYWKTRDGRYRKDRGDRPVFGPFAWFDVRIFLNQLVCE